MYMENWKLQQLQDAFSHTYKTTKKTEDWLSTQGMQAKKKHETENIVPLPLYIHLAMQSMLHVIAHQTPSKRGYLTKQFRSRDFQKRIKKRRVFSQLHIFLSFLFSYILFQLLFRLRLLFFLKLVL